MENVVAIQSKLSIDNTVQRYLFRRMCLKLILLLAKLKLPKVVCSTNINTKFALKFETFRPIPLQVNTSWLLEN